jgi:hypothetical protein
MCKEGCVRGVNAMFDCGTKAEVLVTAIAATRAKREKSVRVMVVLCFVTWR